MSYECDDNLHVIVAEISYLNRNNINYFSVIHTRSLILMNKRYAVHRASKDKSKAKNLGIDGFENYRTFLCEMINYKCFGVKRGTCSLTVLV